MFKSISCIFTLFLLLPVVAGAETIRLPHIWRDSCYDTAGNVISCAGTGQDDDPYSGVPWPNPRFVANGNCVNDNLTGLMWAKDGNLAGQHTWQGGLDWVSNFNKSGGQCGYTDWRLPNRKELQSLVNRQQPNSATWLNTQGFSNVQASWYWSSSNVVYGKSGAWGVSMGSGRAYGYGPMSNGYVWPVRTGQK
jgi:hypothetical protein